MRFRILRRGKAGHHSIPEQPLSPKNTPAPPRAAELDNPYGRVFGKARSREELRENSRK